MSYEPSNPALWTKDSEEYVLAEIISFDERAPEYLDFVQGVLLPKHFSVPSFAIVYTAIMELWESGAAWDFIILKNHLTLHYPNKFTEAGWAYELMTIQSKSVGGALFRHHVQAIVDTFTKRELCRIGNEMATYAGDSDIFEAMQLFSEKLASLQIGGATFMDAATAATDAMTRFNKRYEYVSRGEPIPGLILTHSPAVNEVMGGAEPGEFVIIAGRAGMGKTRYAVDWAAHLAVDRDVFYGSYEMPGRSFALRRAAQSANVGLIQARKGEMQAGEYLRMQQGFTDFAKLRITFDFDRRLTTFLSRARSWAKRAKNPAAIFVDYIQIMDSGANRNANRDQQIGMISGALKGLAMELDLPVIALSQVNRGVEKNANWQDKMPSLSDLRESGTMEQDADVAKFLMRPYYYDKNAYDDSNFRDEYSGRKFGPGDTVVNVAKHRMGEGGVDVIIWEHAQPVGTMFPVRGDEMGDVF